MNRNHESFADRMQEARDLAQVARNKGRAVGKPAAGWIVKRRYDWDINSWEWLAHSERKQWQRDKLRLQNEFIVAAINPIGDDWNDSWEQRQWR